MENEKPEATENQIRAAFFEAVKQGIRFAETGSVPYPFIRTAASSNSSAWGPYQITMSLARLALHKGIFSSDPTLEKWVESRFIPHGKKLLASSPADKTFGLAGPGELTSLEDKILYEKMADCLILHTLKSNKWNVKESVGEWRYGRGQRKLLQKKDPSYWLRFQEGFFSFFEKHVQYTA